ncbi:MAG TPA: SGNH/GDSL hydrolase family protein [Accumulibacter sp.]|uniref:SGNH/GDSL hydrolase family protein n=1 Tax=Accumulibacter sp. TaxID=2053492 RepID=UPI002B6B05F3|nr:SGNH/GDSL hydrolase family protein [Accumulibacter sp.]HNK04668.1 SGNH/GDSL hydrolase family protein [Accumulibacter sp.]
MKKYSQLPNKLALVILLAAISTVLVLLYIRNDRTFDTLPNLPQRSLNDSWAEQTKVAVIGDSWVAGQKLDQAIRDSLKSAGIDAEVVSSGHPGAKSRQILRDLIASKSEPYSSRSLLDDQEIDYLVVLAGVNDTAGHIGADFYAHHMFSIIKLAQSQGVFPIVVEVPEYGIEDTPSEGILSYTKRLLYKALFDNMRENVITAYRHALKTKLDELGEETFAVVSFGPVVADYSDSKDLYANPSHLNKSGYIKLGKHIGKTIAGAHNKRMQADTKPRGQINRCIPQFISRVVSCR